MNSATPAPEMFVSSAMDPIDDTASSVRTLVTSLILAGALSGLAWLMLVFLFQSLL